MEKQSKTRQPLCGFLNIHVKTGLLRTYKSKWFVYCDETGRLLYYKSKGELTPEGEIPITHATFTFDVKEKPGVFEIRTGDVVTPLEAGDVEEMFTWLQELQNRRKDIIKKRSAGSAVSVDNEELSGEAASRVELEDHPPIVVSEQSKGEKSTTPVTMSRLSQNVSKAAVDAKQRLSAIFMKKSADCEFCPSCEALQVSLDTAVEDARVAREELTANQEVLKMLHSQADLLTEQVHTLQTTKKISSDPDLATHVEQVTEIQRLKQKIEQLILETKKQAEEKESLEREVEALKERQGMCEETIFAKDSVIVSLSEQLVKLQPTTVSSPLTGNILPESFHQSVKDKMEAYELQNKFLNKEILELHSVRLDDEKRMAELHRKNVQLEAKYYEMHSKYLLVLNEITKPTLSGDGTSAEPPDELMNKLLTEAMEIDMDHVSSPQLRDNIATSLRTKRKYDSYGFEVEGWADDVTVQAADLLNKSQLLVASVHETPEAMSLRVKWENFLAVSSTQRIERTVEFKNLIRAGIPKNHREKVWNILVNFHVGKFKKTVGPEYYDRLCKKHSTMKHNPVAKQIELDLKRTLPNNKYFEDESSEGIPKLRRILLAYSYHNSTIGYCQGMNRVAAFALLFLKERDAFWCLVAIIDFIMPQDYFSVSMLTAQADQRVLREILTEKIPNVTKHLESLELDISLFSFNWFLTLFIENIPTCTVLRIWDAFLFEGIKILFRYATAFFKSSEEGILKCRDYISANQFLRGIGATMTDVDKITHIAFNDLNPFPIRMINSKRALYLEQVKSELKELNALREEIRSQRPQFDYDSEDDLADDDDNVGETAEGSEEDTPTATLVDI